MKNIKHKTTGEVIRVLDVMAKAFIKQGEWSYISKGAYKSKLSRLAKVNKNVARLNTNNLKHYRNIGSNYVDALFNNPASSGGFHQVRLKISL